jgi:Ca2+-binding EF-hand superfamily protein
MGNKGAKGAKGGKPAASNKPAELTKKDYDFLVQQTGLQKPEIKAVFDKFNANNPDGKLDKKEFVRLYDELRPEPPEVLDEISEYVFRAFDSDHNGFISFNEFMVAYAMTSRGDPTKKLNYAFDVYVIYFFFQAFLFNLFLLTKIFYN